MNAKKELLLGIAILLLVLSLINSFLLLTGYATSTATGEVSMCLNNPPVFLNLADQNAIISEPFTYQILAFDTNGDGISYFDDSFLFNISASGVISFTPVVYNVSNVTIILQDNSSCSNNNNSETFQLAVIDRIPEPQQPKRIEEGGGGGCPRGYVLVKGRCVKPEAKITPPVQETEVVPAEQEPVFVPASETPKSATSRAALIGQAIRRWLGEILTDYSNIWIAFVIIILGIISWIMLKPQKK